MRHVSAAGSCGAVLLLSFEIATAAVMPRGAQAPVSCAIPNPCALYSNMSTGPAVEGASASGTGLFGTSSSGVYYAPGVDGESSDPDGEDAGGAFGINVIATGVAPQYGVIAYGNGIGLAGEENSAGTSVSNSGYGVFGQDTTGDVSNHADYNVGVVGASTVGTGVLGEANGSPTSNDFGLQPIGVYGVANPSANGTTSIALFGESSSESGLGLALSNSATNGSAEMLASNYLISISDRGGFFDIDTGGNEVLSGKLTTSKGTYVRSTGASGTARTEYSERATLPELEDVGEGRLTNGRADVPIDPSLADSVDRRTTYHVFVTPDGDCKGLYVSQRTGTGFTVRELQGGRSSLAFEYRIVAKPRDEDGVRLAIAPALKATDRVMRFGQQSGRSSVPPLSPQERLKRRMGTRAYAEAMMQIRARQRAIP